MITHIDICRQMTPSSALSTSNTLYLNVVGFLSAMRDTQASRTLEGGAATSSQIVPPRTVNCVFSLRAFPAGSGECDRQVGMSFFHVDCRALHMCLSRVAGAQVFLIGSQNVCLFVLYAISSTVNNTAAEQGDNKASSASVLCMYRDVLQHCQCTTRSCLLSTE